MSGAQKLWASHSRICSWRRGKAHHRQQQHAAPEIGVAKLPPELLEKGGRSLPLGRPGHPGQGDHPGGQKQQSMRPIQQKKART